MCFVTCEMHSSFGMNTAGPRRLCLVNFTIGFAVAITDERNIPQFVFFLQIDDTG